jgi:integrase
MNLIALPEGAAIAGCPVTPATARHYHVSTVRLIAYLGNVPLATISPQDIIEWQTWLSTTPANAVTRNSYRRAIRAMFNRLDRPDLAQAIRMEGEPRRRGKAASDLTVQRLVAGCRYERDRALIRFMADSGCRRGAIPGLMKAEMRIGPDFRVKALVTEKGGQRRPVFANENTGRSLLLWFMAQPAGAQHVFTHLKVPRPLALPTINSIFRHACERAGLPTVNPHALRHRFAQQALRRLDVKVVSQLMGHRDAATTLDIYGHRSVDDLEKLYFGD